MIFMNEDNSVNIETRLVKFCVLILDIIMERTMSHSQIYILGPSSYFMLFRFLQNVLNILRFLP